MSMDAVLLQVQEHSELTRKPTFSILVGVLPNTLVTVQAGVTLAALASPDDFTLLTPQNIIMTIVICICLLIPIILHRNSEDPTAEAPKPASNEDGLAQV